MKAILGLVCVGLVLMLSGGCSTPQSVARLEGKGKSRTYDAPFPQVWAAAIDAAQKGDLQVLEADKASGQIIAKRGLRLESFGENVAVWVHPLGSDKTEVEVVSRQAGPPVLWLKNWQNDVLQAIAANLTRYEDLAEFREPTGSAQEAIPTVEDESGRGGVTLPRGELREADRHRPIETEREDASLDELLRRERLKREQELRDEQSRRGELFRRELELLNQQRAATNQTER
jgi:hypothetical protein